MSPSDQRHLEIDGALASVVARLAELSRTATAQGHTVPEATLRQLMSVTVRLYAASVEHAGHEVAPTDASISTTEAVVAAVALLRAQNLTAFETALWFARLPQRPQRSDNSFHRETAP